MAGTTHPDIFNILNKQLACWFLRTAVRREGKENPEKSFQKPEKIYRRKWCVAWDRKKPLILDKYSASVSILELNSYKTRFDFWPQGLPPSSCTNPSPKRKYYFGFKARRVFPGVGISIKHNEETVWFLFVQITWSLTLVDLITQNSAQINNRGRQSWWVDGNGIVENVENVFERVQFSSVLISLSGLHKVLE